MIQYCYFIIFGIILYFIFNLHEKFNISIVYRIPIGNNPYLTRNSNIRLSDVENVDHTPYADEDHYEYLPLNQLYLENGQWYFYTDRDVDLPFMPDSLLTDIRDSINQEIINRRKREKEMNAYNKFIQFGLNSLNKNEIHLLLDTENPDIILTEAQDDLLNSRLINIRYGRIELYLNRRDTILNLYNNIDLTLNWQYFYNYDQYDLGVILGDIWRFEINDLIRKLKDIVNMQKRNEPIIGFYKYIIHFFGLDARLIALLLRHARRLSCAVRATPLKK